MPGSKITLFPRNLRFVDEVIAILTKFVIIKLFLSFIILPRFVLLLEVISTSYFDCSMITELHVFFYHLLNQ